jgi:hypothetical protein
MELQVREIVQQLIQVKEIAVDLAQQMMVVLAVVELAQQEYLEEVVLEPLADLD